MTAINLALSGFSLILLLIIGVLWWRSHAEQRRERAEARYPGHVPPRPMPPPAVQPWHLPAAAPPAVVSLRGQEPPRQSPPSPPPAADEQVDRVLYQWKSGAHDFPVSIDGAQTTASEPPAEPESCRASDYSSSSSSDSGSYSSGGGE